MELINTMSRESFHNFSQSSEAYVRLLDETDANAFDLFCRSYPTRLLTLRLNIEKFGFQSVLTSSWGAFAGANAELIGVAMLYGNTMIVVDRDGECASSFTPLIERTPGIAGIRGTKEVAVGVQGLLKKYVPTDWEESFLMRLAAPPKISEQKLALARRATLEDLEPLAALYQGAGLMYRAHSNVKQKLSETRVFIVEDFDLGASERATKPRILSCALLNVEGADSAIIGGVYTLPYARGRGYAAACTAALCADLQKDGKSPHLFYENPKAGSVYRSLGFEPIGRWGVIYVASPEG